MHRRMDNLKDQITKAMEETKDEIQELNRDLLRSFRNGEIIAVKRPYHLDHNTFKTFIFAEYGGFLHKIGILSTKKRYGFIRRGVF